MGRGWGADRWTGVAYQGSSRSVAPPGSARPDAELVGDAPWSWPSAGPNPTPTRSSSTATRAAPTSQLSSMLSVHEY
jgi:hypothetical protein